MTEAFEGSFADVAADVPYPGVSRRTVDAPAATVNRYDFAPGATFPRHRHPQEQITLVLEGSVEEPPITGRVVPDTPVGAIHRTV